MLFMQILIAKEAHIKNKPKIKACPKTQASLLALNTLEHFRHSKYFFIESQSRKVHRNLLH